MPDRSHWLVGIPGVGLLAVIALALLGAEPQRGKRPAGPAEVAATPAADRQPADHVRGAADYLERAGVVTKVRWRWPEIEWPEPGTSVRYLVVTLPDPLTSQTGTLFDQGVDAVTQALVDAGHVLDGHWFPWDPTAGGPRATPGASADGPEQPGVLVYRSRADRAARVVVLVVGENAMTGVRAGALATALDLAGGPGTPGRLVRVVGPVFSGSQPSLARGLRAFAGGRTGPVFRVSSGWAVGLSPWADVDPDANPRVPLNVLCGGPIQTTSVPLPAQRLAALHYLTRPGRVDPTQQLTAAPVADPWLGRDAAVRYAALIELNTGYGAAAAGAEAKPGAGPAAPDWTRPAVLIRFPMHVSRMAALVSKARRDREERLGLFDPGPAGLAALDAARSGGDLIPAADEGRTAAANLRLLEGLLGQIRRERIRYVEVVATDTRDRVFLIEQLRRHCPHAVPFTYGMDLLLGHPEYLPFTCGTVVATSYPLRVADQRALGPGRRTGFVTSGAQGTYNAVLGQFGRPDLMVGYAPPDPAPGAPTTPPVWLTAVGENGAPVPLAYFTNLPPAPMVPGPPAPAPAAARRPGPVPHSPAFRYVILGVGLAGVGVVAVGSGAYRRRPDEPAMPPAVASLRTLYAAVTAAGAVFAALPFVAYLAVVYQSGAATDWPDWGATAVAGAVLVAGVTAVAAVAVGWAAGFRGGRAAGGAGLLTGLACAGTAVVVGWFVADWAGVGAARQALFAERAADLETGASPVVPALVFAAGFGLYGLTGLVLVRDLTDRRVRCPFPAGAGYAVDLVARTDGPLTDLLTHPLRVFWSPTADPGERVRWGGVTALVAVLSGGLVILDRVHPTWEARGWNCLFATGFVGLAYLTVASGYRLYAVWKGVEQAARAVMAVPMGRAFDRLPDKVGRVFGSYLLTRRWRRLDLALLDHIRDRTVAAVRDAAGHEWDDRWARAAWDRIRPLAEAPADPARGYADRLNDLSALAGELVAALGPHWAGSKRSAGETFGGVPVPAGQDAPAPETWTDWAEQLVAVTAVVYLSQFFVSMRRLAAMAAVAAGALLTAATTYQFQPERLVMTAGLVLPCGVVAVTVWVLYRVNRNELVSRVCRSTPNRFSPDSAFASNVVTLVLPLALVVAAQFAGRTRVVIEPVLGWFR